MRYRQHTIPDISCETTQTVNQEDCRELHGEASLALANALCLEEFVFRACTRYVCVESNTIPAIDIRGNPTLRKFHNSQHAQLDFNLWLLNGPCMCSLMIIGDSDVLSDSDVLIQMVTGYSDEQASD